MTTGKRIVASLGLLFTVGLQSAAAHTVPGLPIHAHGEHFPVWLWSGLAILGIVAFFILRRFGSLDRS